MIQVLKVAVRGGDADSLGAGSVCGGHRLQGAVWLCELWMGLCGVRGSDEGLRKAIGPAM
jgi:hypothetical protein